jgi:hypothetical protein
MSSSPPIVTNTNKNSSTSLALQEGMIGITSEIILDAHIVTNRDAGSRSSTIRALGTLLLMYYDHN